MTKDTECFLVALAFSIKADTYQGPFPDFATVFLHTLAIALVLAAGLMLWKGRE